MFATIPDDDKQRAVTGFVTMNPYMDGIDFTTMMEIILDADMHIPIIGDVEIGPDEAAALVDVLINQPR